MDRIYDPSLIWGYATDWTEKNLPKKPVKLQIRIYANTINGTYLLTGPKLYIDEKPSHDYLRNVDQQALQQNSPHLREVLLQEKRTGGFTKIFLTYSEFAQTIGLLQPNETPDEKLYMADYDLLNATTAEQTTSILSSDMGAYSPTEELQRIRFITESEHIAVDKIFNSLLRESEDGFSGSHADLIGLAWSRALKELAKASMPYHPGWFHEGVEALTGKATKDSRTYFTLGVFNLALQAEARDALLAKPLPKMHDGPRHETPDDAAPAPRKNTDGSARERYWTITLTDFSSFPHVTLAPTREIAINVFMQDLYLLLHIMKDNKFKIVGEDDDAALTGLHLIEVSGEHPTCYLSMTAPATASIQESSAPFSFGNRANFRNIAGQLQATVDAHSPKITLEQARQTYNSFPAMILAGDTSEELIDSINNDTHPHPVPPERLGAIWTAMKEVRLWMTTMARIIAIKTQKRQ